jgi:Protein of unknown function (DUF1214)
MSGEAAKRLLSGRAWDDFCDVIRLAGHAVDRFGTEADELDRTEWYRFVTRLMRNGLERFVENCEPERPRLRETSWRQSINFQSPDQDHLLVEFVDGAEDYRITGDRGTVPYFVMASWTAPQPASLGARDWAVSGYAGLQEFDPARLRATGVLQSSAMQFDAAGHFEVIVSRERPAGVVNWLPLTPDCVGLLIRVVFHERTRERPPSMRIERVNGATPRPLQAAQMSEALAKAGQVVLGYTELVRAWWQENLTQWPNRIRFSRSLYSSNGGIPDRHHGFGRWEKRSDEALVVQFRPPECDYWIFQLCNIWQENLDVYEEGQGYATKYRSRLERDGSVRIVIADRDPGVGGNWLDPAGHTHGGMSLRLILTHSPPPGVLVHRVPVQALERNGFASLRPVDAILSGEIVD